MNLLYLSSSTIPSRAANSIHVMKMCEAFSQNGYTTTLIAKVGDNYKNTNVFNYYGVSSSFKIIVFKNRLKKISNFIYSIKCFAHALLNNYDYIYGRNFIGCVLTSIVSPTVIELHGPIGSLKTKILKFSLKYLKLKHIVVISTKLKEYLLEDFQSFGHRIIIAHDGASSIDNKNMDMPEITNCDLNVGYVGHLYKGRGIDLILKVARELPEVGFNIVGGTQEDIKYWTKQLEVLQLSNVVFYGFVPPCKAQLFMKAVDVLLAPYTSDVKVYGGDKTNTSSYMSPLKIFEYMSANKALVATDLPVLREVLNQENSILVEEANVQEWVKALQKLKAKDLRAFLAKNALNDFENKYTWHKRIPIVMNNR